ncbi:hypothetical protein AMC78_CH01357 [Rhizobium phaseoli]|nr:hypothetical protein AMC78_CH01357 [Rhizobium phaseoli]
MRLLLMGPVWMLGSRPSMTESGVGRRNIHSTGARVSDAFASKTRQCQSQPKLTLVKRRTIAYAQINEVGHLNHGYTYSGHSVATSYSYFTRSDCLIQAYPKR